MAALSKLRLLWRFNENFLTKIHIHHFHHTASFVAQWKKKKNGVFAAVKFVMKKNCTFYTGNINKKWEKVCEIGGQESTEGGASEIFEKSKWKRVKKCMWNGCGNRGWGAVSSLFMANLSASGEEPLCNCGCCTSLLQAEIGLRAERPLPICWEGQEDSTWSICSISQWLRVWPFYLRTAFRRRRQPLLPLSH